MSKDSKAAYYDVGSIETIAILKAKLTEEECTGFLKGNAIKHLCRMAHKGDAEKAALYATWLFEALPNCPVAKRKGSVG